MGNPQEPTVRYRELCQCYAAAGVGGSLGANDMCIHTAEPLCCTPEAITTLLTGFQNRMKNFKKYLQQIMRNTPTPNNLRKHLFHRRKADSITQKLFSPRRMIRETQIQMVFLSRSLAVCIELYQMLSMQYQPDSL